MTYAVFSGRNCARSSPVIGADERWLTSSVSTKSVLMPDGKAVFSVDVVSTRSGSARSRTYAMRSAG